MYEVFINSKRLVFESVGNEKKYGESWLHFSLIKSTFNWNEFYVTSIMPPENDNLVCFAKNPALEWKYFRSNFKLIKAAGGLVVNNKNECLFIFRNGKWDLPKGKIEKGEKNQLAAKREVTEETGVDKLKIISKLKPTYHLYELNNKWILKKTYWYVMSTSTDKMLNPQIEEGITAVKWLNKVQIRNALSNTYALVEQLVESYFFNK